MSHLTTPLRSRWTDAIGVRSLTRALAMTAATAVGVLTLTVPAQADERVAAPVPAAEVRGLQQALDRMVADGAPGAILYSYDNGRVTALRSGVADLASGTPLVGRSRFRIGSLTKTYVATAVLQLVAQHRVRLDAPASDYLPGLLAAHKQITVRQLLNHTSGIFDFNDDPRVLAPYLDGDLGHVWTPRHLVRIALGNTPVAPADAAYHYSNTNYVLAGLIVEGVTGHRLGDVLRRRVFSRAHLTATTFDASRTLPEPAAHGYFAFPGDRQPTDITSFYPYPWAAGAAAATAPDVARFYRRLLSGRLLPSRMMAAMRHTVEASGDGGRREAYGLGLGRISTPCGPAWGHGGNFPGYVTYAYSSSDGSRQTVLMVNEDPMSLPATAGAQFRRLFLRSFCGSDE